MKSCFLYYRDSAYIHIYACIYFAIILITNALCFCYTKNTWCYIPRKGWQTPFLAVLKVLKIKFILSFLFLYCLLQKCLLVLPIKMIGRIINRITVLSENALNFVTMAIRIINPIHKLNYLGILPTHSARKLIFVVNLSTRFIFDLCKTFVGFLWNCPITIH